MRKLAPTNTTGTTELANTAPIASSPLGARSHREPKGIDGASMGTATAPALKQTTRSTSPGAKRSSIRARECKRFQIRSVENEWATRRRLRIPNGTRTSARKDKLDALGTR